MQTFRCYPQEYAEQYYSPVIEFVPPVMKCQQFAFFITALGLFPHASKTNSDNKQRHAMLLATGKHNLQV